MHLTQINFITVDKLARDFTTQKNHSERTKYPLIDPFLEASFGKARQITARNRTYVPAITVLRFMVIPRKIRTVLHPVRGIKKGEWVKENPQYVCNKLLLPHLRSLGLRCVASIKTFHRSGHMCSPEPTSYSDREEDWRRKKGTMHPYFCTVSHRGETRKMKKLKKAIATRLTFLYGLGCILGITKYAVVSLWDDSLEGDTLGIYI